MPCQINALGINGGRGGSGGYALRDILCDTAQELGIVRPAFPDGNGDKRRIDGIGGTTAGGSDDREKTQEVWFGCLQSTLLFPTGAVDQIEISVTLQEVVQSEKV